VSSISTLDAMLARYIRCGYVSVSV